MAKRRVLVCWIGHSDLRAMAGTLAADLQQQMLERLGGTLPRADEHGPLRTLIDRESFDEILLLSNYSADWTKRYVSWLGGRAKAVRVELQDPTDYIAIFQIADTSKETNFTARMSSRRWPNCRSPRGNQTSGWTGRWKQVLICNST